MLLAMDTWSAACCWASICTMYSMVWPASARCCSIQVSGRASAELCPCSRRTSSATNELVIGGFERAMSATLSTMLFGSHSAASVIRSAQSSARLRSFHFAMTREATRRRFSIKARRSMIGIAHNSPRVSGVTVW
ncbi:hypothetical protein D3C78_638690 [compost metagenome]